MLHATPVPACQKTSSSHPMPCHSSCILSRKGHQEPQQCPDICADRRLVTLPRVPTNSSYPPPQVQPILSLLVVQLDNAPKTCTNLPCRSKDTHHTGTTTPQTLPPCCSSISAVHEIAPQTPPTSYDNNQKQQTAAYSKQHAGSRTLYIGLSHQQPLQ